MLPNNGATFDEPCPLDNITPGSILCDKALLCMPHYLLSLIRSLSLASSMLHVGSTLLCWSWTLNVRTNRCVCRAGSLSSVHHTTHLSFWLLCRSSAKALMERPCLEWYNCPIYFGWISKMCCHARYDDDSLLLPHHVANDYVDNRFLLLRTMLMFAPHLRACSAMYHMPTC